MEYFFHKSVSVVSSIVGTDNPPRRLDLWSSNGSHADQLVLVQKFQDNLKSPYKLGSTDRITIKRVRGSCEKGKYV